jgi:hypothetical protein
MAVVTVNPMPPPQVAGAIKQAAETTGTSFEYLLATARIESGLNSAAEAATSTASGLYQFIDQTWLAMVKSVGPSLGLSNYAQAIVQAPDGRYGVPDASARSAILKLRNDPTVSAMMAGAFTRNNEMQLAQAIGRQPNEAELYIAHFLGADGAARLINTVNAQPRTNAAGMFPAAAAANRSIFYDAGGRPRSAAAVYGRLTTRFETARAASVTPDLRGSERMADAAGVPDTAGITQVLASANDSTASAGSSAAADSRPLFQSMFSDRGAAAVAPAVVNLWTQGGARGPTGRGLDLFTDGKPDLRGMFGAS